MPRDGSGRAHNATEESKEFEHNITHGAGTEQVSKLFFLSGRSSKSNTKNQPDHVARADKTAPMPEPEKGAAMEGVNAAAGSNKGSDSTKP